MCSMWMGCVIRSHPAVTEGCPVLRVSFLFFFHISSDMAQIVQTGTLSWALFLKIFNFYIYCTHHLKFKWFNTKYCGFFFSPFLKGPVFSICTLSATGAFFLFYLTSEIPIPHYGLPFIWRWQITLNPGLFNWNSYRPHKSDSNSWPSIWYRICKKVTAFVLAGSGRQSGRSLPRRTVSVWKTVTHTWGLFFDS